ncbi:hypothetical protein P7C70_g2291, partial [Phenoliferia sp. Uapishka_3]
MDVPEIPASIWTEPVIVVSDSLARSAPSARTTTGGNWLAQEEQQKHLRPPSYHLSLPLELLAKVCTFADVDDLLSLALVAKDFNAAASFQIYGKIELDWRTTRFREVSAHCTSRAEWHDGWLRNTEEGRAVLELAESHFPVDAEGFAAGGRDDRSRFQTFLSHRADAASILNGDVEWLVDTNQASAVFYRWIGTLNNLRSLITKNFTHKTTYEEIYEGVPSTEVPLAAPVLRSIERLSITSDDSSGSGTTLNLMVLPHLSSIRHLDLNLKISEDLSSMSSGPPLLHLESLRIQLVGGLQLRGHDGFVQAAGFFDRITNLGQLVELRLSFTERASSPERSFLLVLIDILPALSGLRYLQLYYQDPEPDSWDPLNDHLPSAIAKTSIKTLHLCTWPTENFLSLLPNSITTLVIEDLSSLSSMTRDTLKSLRQCLGWKQNHLPNLQELRIAARPRRSSPQDWTAVTSLAEGFLFTYGESIVRDDERSWIVRDDERTRW